MSSLREAMPETAAFVDFCREVFGAEAVNASIRAGIAGIPDRFHAVENGQESGTPCSPPRASYTLDELWITPTQTKATGKK